MATTTPAPATPAKKPIYKRVWFWILAVILAVILINAVSGGDGDETAAPAPAAPSAEQPQEQAPAPAPADDPAEDDGWRLEQAEVNGDLVNSVTARITNTENSTRSAFFTISVLSNGQFVGDATGAANEVEPGVTATVTLLGTDEIEGDPASFTYELQATG